MLKRKFDLYIVNPIRFNAFEISYPGDNSSFRKRGWLNLGEELTIVKGLLKQILDAKGNAYVVPMEYRTARISAGLARHIAIHECKRLSGEGKNIGPLSDVIDDMLWWTFYADDLDLIDKDVYPGKVTISIDKLDGHIRTKEEFQEWLKLSSI